MPQLRQDELTGRWIVMAPERANRPMSVQDQPADVPNVCDPFAEGSEHMTGPEVMALRRDGFPADGSGWTLRVVKNKYPAFQLSPSAELSCDQGADQSISAIGAHEVIVECPQFEANLARLPVESFRDLFDAYRERLAFHKRDPRLVHATVFKNKGALAGASLGHSHSQLVVTPFIPNALEQEFAAALMHYQKTGRSIFDEILEKELKATKRIVIESRHVVAYCPYASRFPYEMCLMPKSQISHYEDSPQEVLDDLATVMKEVLERLTLVLNDPPYNFILHTAAFLPGESPSFRWHIELFPRITRPAGFEWGTGCFVNEVLPELAAARIRPLASTIPSAD